MPSAPARRLPLELAAAAAGLIGGHTVAYLLSVPAAIRRLTLDQSGHAYLPRAIAAAAALAVVAIAGTALRGARRGWRGDRDHLSFGATFRRLAVVQTVGFAVLEVLERKAAGMTLDGLGGLFPRGLMVQLIVAAVAALALWLLDRAAASIARGIRARRHVVRTSLVTTSCREDHRAIALVPTGSISPRGPPLLARS